MSALRADAYQDMAVQSEQDSAASVHPKRLKHDYEALRLRLLDQGFSMKRYPDPIVPRQQSEQYPPGVTPEIEQRWLSMIEKYRQKLES